MKSEGRLRVCGRFHEFFMLNNEHLAIASVPIQSWDKVYDENEALCHGMIFPALYKPFFVTEETDKPEIKQDKCPSAQQLREDMLLQIQRRKELLKEYALQFYPLTMDCMVDIYENDPDSECYCWQNGLVPWEGACV